MANSKFKEFDDYIITRSFTCEKYWIIINYIFWTLAWKYSKEKKAGVFTEIFFMGFIEKKEQFNAESNNLGQGNGVMLGLTLWKTNSLPRSNTLHHIVWPNRISNKYRISSL